MHELVRSRLAQIEALCRTLGIRRLDLFGSAAEGTFDPETSDVDVLAEFIGGDGFDYLGTYFALKEGGPGADPRPPGGCRQRNEHPKPALPRAGHADAGTALCGLITSGSTPGTR